MKSRSPAEANTVDATSVTEGTGQPEELVTSLVTAHLDWSHKQSRILTADGLATTHYQRFPFEPEELPHHHLLSNQTNKVFSEWSEKAADNNIVCGAWTRSLFYGGWEHSTARDEITSNVQTPTLFVDLRIPTTRHKLLPDSARSLGDYDDSQLRMYARQHVFAGYTGLGCQDGRPFCTRFHCIDWNFVGLPRPIPNKWWVQMREDNKKWKEWAYPTDEDGQHYYCEHWERLHGGTGYNVTLALRMKPSTEGPDGVFVVVDDHFSYVVGRRMTGSENNYPNAGSLVDLVDEALACGDRHTAESYLSIEAGHGVVSKGWVIDCSIQPWKEGTRIPKIEVHGNDKLRDSQVAWMGMEWEIYSSSFSTASELKNLVESVG